MQVRSGAVATCKSANVCDPAQPLKSYARVIVVTCSSGATTKVIGAPWEVVPLQVPVLKDAPVNGIGKSGEAHALTRMHDSAAHREPALSSLAVDMSSAT